MSDFTLLILASMAMAIAVILATINPAAWVLIPVTVVALIGQIIHTRNKRKLGK